MGVHEGAGWRRASRDGRAPDAKHRRGGRTATMAARCGGGKRHCSITNATTKRRTKSGEKGRMQSAANGKERRDGSHVNSGGDACEVGSGKGR